ncbi:MAG: hypothetical protein ABI574_00125 [Burkholderiales bacterium]
MTSAATQSLHRRAAYATLLPLLGQQAALGALELVQDTLHSDAASDVIAFVDSLSQRHALDDASRRRLYASLFATLRGPREQLPPDPWPLTGHAPSAPRAPQWNPALWSATAAMRSPVAPWLATAAMRSPVAPWLATMAEPHATAVLAEHVVFDALVQALIRQVQDAHAASLAALRDACLVEFQRAQISAVTRETACAAWYQHLQLPTSHAWRIPATREELAELVLRFYLALCRVLGPMPADRLLAQAARAAATLPEAQDCPPGHLL